MSLTLHTQWQDRSGDRWCDVCGCGCGWSIFQWRRFYWNRRVVGRCQSIAWQRRRILTSATVFCILIGSQWRWCRCRCRYLVSAQSVAFVKLGCRACVLRRTHSATTRSGGPVCFICVQEGGIFVVLFQSESKRSAWLNWTALLCMTTDAKKRPQHEEEENTKLWDDGAVRCGARDSVWLPSSITRLLQRQQQTEIGSEQQQNGRAVSRNANHKPHTVWPLQQLFSQFFQNTKNHLHRRDDDGGDDCRWNQDTHTHTHSSVLVGGRGRLKLRVTSVQPIYAAAISRGWYTSWAKKPKTHTKNTKNAHTRNAHAHATQRTWRETTTTTTPARYATPHRTPRDCNEEACFWSFSDDPK